MVVIQRSGYLPPGISSTLVTHSRAVVSPQQTRNHTHRTSPQTFEKHWCIPSGLHPISCSGFKPFQSGICPSHSAENAIEKVTDLLMAKFGRFFFFVLIVCDISAAFDTLFFYNITEVVLPDLPDNSFFPSSFQAFLLLPTPWPPSLFILHSHRLLLDNLIDVL